MHLFIHEYLEPQFFKKYILIELKILRYSIVILIRLAHDLLCDLNDHFLSLTISSLVSHYRGYENY